MESWAKLLESLAIIAWPLLVLLVIFRFTPAVRGIIDSARSRKFTLKVGGQELTMEEVNEQQRALITDLQEQIVQLKSFVESKMGGEVEAFEDSPRKSIALTPTRPAILWVDDNPKNNSYLVQQFQDSGFDIDLALSTSDGLKRAANRDYTLIISDMGREENRTYNPTAGLDFTRQLREMQKDIPLAIFSSSRAIREYKNQAKELGAVAITSSATELLGAIQKEISKDRK